MKMKQAHIYVDRIWIRKRSVRIILTYLITYNNKDSIRRRRKEYVSNLRSVGSHLLEGCACVSLRRLPKEIEPTMQIGFTQVLGTM